MKELGSYQGTTIYEGDNIAKIMADIDRGKAKQSISANDIQPTTAVSIPNVAPQSSGQTIDAIAQESAQRAAQAQLDFDKSRSSLEDRIKEITTVMGSREDLEREQGLDQANLDVADIQNQIRAREHSLRRAIEDTQRTAGLSGTQIARRVSALNRDAARELADLSIIENARLNRAEAISNNIDRKIKAQLEPLAFQLQFDKMFYEENRDVMSAAQREMFDIKILREQRNYDEQAAEKKSIKDIAIAAAQSGATGEQIVAITDAKNFNEAMQVGGSFLGEPFKQQMLAQKFQQDMAIKTYDLQVRGQNFSESMARQSLALQSQQLEESILARIQENNLTANAEFAKTDEAQAMSVVKGQVGTVNRLFENVVGTSDRDKIDWDTAVKNMSVVRAVANAEARALNPDLSRAASGGDLNAATSLTEKADRLFNQWWKGQNTRVVDIQNAVRSLDSAYESRLQQANIAQQRISALYPNSQIISTYNTTSTLPLRTQIDTALQQNFPPETILSQIQSNPLFTDSINNALGQGYTPLSILNFLKTQ
jgi:hypothetical protein